MQKPDVTLGSDTPSQQAYSSTFVPQTQAQEFDYSGYGLKDPNAKAADPRFSDVNTPDGQRRYDYWKTYQQDQAIRERNLTNMVQEGRVAALPVPQGESLYIQTPEHQAYKAYEYYMLNTNPVEWSYQSQRIEDFKKQAQEGEHLSAQERLEDPKTRLYQEALYQRESEALSFAAQGSYADFLNKEKQYEEPLKKYDEMVGLAKQLESWPADDQGNPVFTPERDMLQYNKLVNDFSMKRDEFAAMDGEAAVMDIGAIQQQTAAYNQALNSSIKKYPAYYLQTLEQKTKANMVQRSYEEYPVLGFVAQNITNPVASALSSAVVSTFYLPKALGDGDEYGWTDSIYDQAAQWKRVSIDPVTPVPQGDIFDNPVLILPKTVETATNLALMWAGGSAVGTAFGGSRTALRVGTFASGAASTMEGYYRAGKSAGMTDAEAETYSLASGAIQGALELVNPEPLALATMPTRATKTYMDAIANGVSRPAAIKEAGRYIARNILKEQAQETSQLLAEYGVNSVANTLTGADLNGKRDFWNELAETAVITTLVAGGTGAVGARGSRSRLNNEATYAVGIDPEKYKTRVLAMQNAGEISAEKAQYLTQSIERAAAVAERIPKSLSAEAAVKVVPIIEEKMRLEEEAKNIDAAFATQAQEEIAKKEEEIREAAGIKTQQEDEAPAQPTSEVQQVDQQELTQEEQERLSDYDMFFGEGVTLPEGMQKDFDAIREKARRLEAKKAQPQKESAGQEAVPPQPEGVTDPEVKPETATTDEQVRDQQTFDQREEGNQGRQEVKTPVEEEFESLDETTAPPSDDQETVAILRDDMAILNAVSGKVLSEGGVVKKFSAVARKINQAFKDGKLTKETANTFMEAAKNARNRRIKEPLGEAEAALIKALKSINIISKDDTIKKASIGIDLKDVIHIGFQVAERALIAGSDMSVAIQKALDTMRRSKAYQRAVEIGSDQDRRIEEELVRELEARREQLGENVTRYREMKSAQRVLASTIADEEVKKGLQEMGTKYKPIGIQMSQETARKYVDYFSAEGKLEEVVNLVRDDSNGVDSTTRGMIAVEAYKDLMNKGAEVKAENPKEGARMIRLATEMLREGMLITSEAGRTVSNAGKAMAALFRESKPGAFLAAVDEQAEQVADDVAKQNKRGAGKTAEEANKAAKEGAEGEALEKAVGKSIKKNLPDLKEEDVNELAAEIAGKIGKSGQISNKEVENLYRDKIKKTLLSDDLLGKVQEEMEFIKKADESKADVKRALKEWKDAEWKAKSSGKTLSKKEKSDFKKSVTDKYTSWQKAEIYAQESADRISNLFRRPRDIWNTLTGVMKGNLLTPISLMKNVSGYPFAMVLRMGTRAIATPLDWMVTMVANRFRPGTKRTISPMAEMYGALKFGLPFAGREAFRRAATGHISPDATKMELNSSINMVNAWKDLFRSKRVGEQRFFENKVAAFVEGTFGAPADLVFRLLNPTDITARRMAQYGRAHEAAYAKGLRGAELWEATLLPDEIESNISKEAGLKASYQQQGPGVRATNMFLSFEWITAIPGVGRHAAGLLKFLRSGVIPFTTTPLNLLGEAIDYTSPLFGFIKGLANINAMIQAERGGNTARAADYRRKATLNFSSMAIAVGLSRIAWEFVKNGLLTGSDDRDDRAGVRSERQQNIKPNSFNWSALGRLMSGDKNWYKINKNDTWVSLGGMGTMGIALGSWANYYKDDSKEEMEQSNVLVDSFFGVLPSTIKSLMEQSFLKGANDALTALYEGGSRSEYFVSGYLTTLSTTFYNNTLATISKTSDDYIRDKRTDEGIGKILENNFKERMFMGNQLPTKVTVWGEPVKNTPPGTTKAMYYFMDPMKSYSVETKEFGYKIFDFWRTTDDKDLKGKIIPTPPSDVITLDGISVQLTPKEYEEYQQIVGKLRARAAQAYVIHGDFESDDPEDRVEELQWIYKDAREQGLDELIMNHERLLNISMGID